MTMFTLALREMTSHKRRVVSTAVAIVLGIAFLAGTLMLTSSIKGAVDGMLADDNASTDAYVQTTSGLELGFGQSRPPLDAALAPRVAAVDGVEAVALRITGYAQLVDKTGKAVGDLAKGEGTMGQNWISAPSLNPYRLERGRAPMGDDDIVIDHDTATSTGFALGDRVTVLSQGPPREMTIVGVARFGDAGSLAGLHTVLFHDAAAQPMLGEPGHVDGIAIAAAPGVSQDELARRVRAVVDVPGVEVVTGKALTDANRKAVGKELASFNTFLLIFAGVALFVGSFIIYNTFSILVAQRSRQMALLRSIGATGKQVTRSLLGESLIVALLASAAGIVVGAGVAKLLKSLLDVFGFRMPAGSPGIDAGTIVTCMIVGVVVTVVSAVMPARRAARIAPIAALRDVALERGTPSKRRIVSGGVLTALGIATLVAGLGASRAQLVGLGAVVVFLGVNVLGPVVARPVVRFVGAPLPRLRGMPGRIARQNALRNPKRTARTAGALMVGVALVGFITIFASSTKASISGSIRDDYHGNYVVDSGSFDGTAGISPVLARSLRETPGVTLLSETRAEPAEVGGVAFPGLSSWEPATIGELFTLGKIEGSLGSLGTDGLAVDKAYARKHGWTLGTKVPVTVAAGTRDYTVRAIFTESSEWLGTVWTALDTKADGLDSRIYLRADRLDTVERLTNAYPSVTVLDKDDLAKASGAEIDKILGLIYVLLALAVVIALLGIANTLALSVHERTRELGLLRAVGMTRRQMRSAVRWESVLIAVFGTGLGLVVGTFFGWTLVRALADQGIDTLVIPVAPLVAVVLIAVVAGLAAAAQPARRAARLDVLSALATS